MGGDVIVGIQKIANDSTPQVHPQSPDKQRIYATTRGCSVRSRLAKERVKNEYATESNVAERGSVLSRRLCLQPLDSVEDAATSLLPLPPELSAPGVLSLVSERPNHPK